MKKLKRIFIRGFLIFLIIIPVATFGHFFIFPQETRSIFIDYSDFERKGNNYFNKSTPPGEIDSLDAFIAVATDRVTRFWGKTVSRPKFIYCHVKNDFEKYSVNPSAPAVTYLRLGSRIVLTKDGLNADVIAHEISHAELYERIGFYRFNYKIPSWFKHGLAMQNDYRGYFSEDNFKIKTGNFKNAPDIKAVKSDLQFYGGTPDEVMLNYMAAKYEVSKWFTREKLNKLILDLNNGIPFETAYSK